ncbi:hypothetical protein RYD26_06600 [Pasteurellaceae bacterium LIM206]|nr:hypothetical protein [Pasteurellaceae bacterium LIM206]
MKKLISVMIKLAFLTPHFVLAAPQQSTVINGSNHIMQGQNGTVYNRVGQDIYSNKGAVYHQLPNGTISTNDGSYCHKVGTVMQCIRNKK